MKQTIMIIEDELDIQQLLTAALQQYDYHPVAFSTGEEALEAFHTISPDLILLDVQLPDMNGFSICEQIRKHSHTPIIFVSCLHDGSDIIRGLEIGGDDYVTKPFDLHQLIARIRSNLRRAPLLHTSRTASPLGFGESEKDEIAIGPLKLHYPSQHIYIFGEHIPLTTKEFQILSILALHPEKTFSAHELYTLIWGQDSLGETQALKVHISHVRRKLEEIPGHSMSISTIRGFGYQFKLE